jgi:hypothetical protein
MVDRYVRIGAIVDGWGYDDDDFPDAAIETTERIISGTAPSNPTDVVRLEDIGDASIFGTLLDNIVVFADEVVCHNNSVVYI